LNAKAMEQNLDDQMEDETKKGAYQHDGWLLDGTKLPSGI